MSKLVEKDRRIRELATAISKALQDVVDAKDELKDCKEVLSNLYDQLHKTASDDCQPELPFPEE